MAPEFIPLIVTALLIISSAVAVVLSLVSYVFPSVIRRLLLVFLPDSTASNAALRISLSVTTVGLVLLTAVCARQVRQVFFLDESLAGAAARGNLEEVRGLLDRGASPNSWGPDHMRPAIAYAASNGRDTVIALLLARGADPNLRDFEGRTALTHARETGNPKTIEILMNAGAQE